MMVNALYCAIKGYVERWEEYEESKIYEGPEMYLTIGRKEGMNRVLEFVKSLADQEMKRARAEEQAEEQAENKDMTVSEIKSPE